MKASRIEQAEQALFKLRSSLRESHKRLDEQESRFGDAYTVTLAKVAKLERLLVDLQSVAETLRSQMQIFELRLNQFEDAIADLSQPDA